MDDARKREIGKEMIKNINHVIKLREKQIPLLKQLAFHGALMEVNVDPKDVKHSLPLLKRKVKIEGKAPPNNFEEKRLFLKGRIKDFWDLEEKFRLATFEKDMLGAVLLKDGTVIDLKTPVNDWVENRKWPHQRR